MAAGSVVVLAEADFMASGDLAGVGLVAAACTVLVDSAVGLEVV
jgi:hypothetical protein